MGLRSRKFAKKNHHKISIASLLLTILFILVFFSLLAYYYLSRDKVLNKLYKEIDVLNNEIRNLTRVENNKVLNFGHESDTDGGDSRYWERDDRIRDLDIVEDNASSVQGEGEGGGGGGGGYDNNNNKEDRRDELKLYEKEFEASLKNVGQSTGENSYRHSLSNDKVQELQNEDDNVVDDEYDDAIDSQDARVTTDHRDELGNQSVDNKESRKAFANGSQEGASQISDEVRSDFRHDSLINRQFINGSTSSDKGLDLKKSPKHHKFSGSNCEMKFLNSTAQLVEPLESADFSKFSLQYTDVEERPSGQEDWTPSFCGHQSLKEREESFYARDQKINCGFVKGPEGSPSTGFDLEKDDMRYMSRCHIAVSSCIFGNSDNLRSPFNKTVTRLSRKHVCFVMFMDEYTLQTLSLEGQKPDESGFIGLWRIVVVKNLPFADMRRVGKIPKLLPHRLFPSSRYSIWLDSKLRLERDPLLILEYFLWRKGREYAISKHYRRHCVWEEVVQNKRLNKFNHTIIDQQFLFYQADGLEKFNASDPNKLLPSNVPEGSVIIRAHTPMSNLFSCLWFNEVDRFTPRDQLSFAYVFHKLRRMNPDKPFHFHMFKDCERRDIAKLFRHKAEENRNVSQLATGRR